ncbi:MAG: hypothetical protein FWD15_04370, partial [Alphaproteobacteria bacterium]|nr:hypothetical protein [Alphaproteobacteria bacterium]
VIIRERRISARDGNKSNVYRVDRRPMDSRITEKQVEKEFKKPLEVKFAEINERQISGNSTYYTLCDCRRVIKIVLV